MQVATICMHISATWICTMLNAATWIKGIVYKKILSSFTNPDVIANQSNLFSSQNTKDDNLKNVSVFLCLYNKSQWMFWTPLKSSSIMTTLGRLHGSGYDNVNVFGLGGIDLLHCCCWVLL